MASTADVNIGSYIRFNNDICQIMEWQYRTRSPMGTGYMSLDKGEMQWTLTYDEIAIVLEGELVITRGNEQMRGKTGDVIYIPKGSSITFGTPSWTRFVYVVFPVNWNEK